MIQRVFIDCDGVLGDFFTAACKAFGVDPDALANETNVIKALAESEKEFWSTIASIPNFYATMPAYHWTNDVLIFLQQLQNYRGTPWEIVFGPSRVPDAREQRAAWCRKNIRTSFSAYRFGASKLHMVPRDQLPETLLIDDSPLEVDRFMAAGGVAILFPNGRNGRHEPDPALWLENQVEKILKTGGVPIEQRPPEGFEVAIPY